MRYKAYCYGQIVGPMEPSELKQQSWFDENTLVCPEIKSGLNASDWKKALEWGDLLGPGDLIEAAKKKEEIQNQKAPPGAPPAPDLVAQIKEIAQTLQIVRNKIENFEDQLAGQRESSNELRGLLGVADKTSQVADLYNATKTLACKFEELEKKIASLAHDGQKQKEEITQNALMDLINAERSKSAAQIEKLRADWASLSKTVETLENRLAASKAPNPEPAPAAVAPAASKAPVAAVQEPKPLLRNEPAKPAPAPPNPPPPIIKNSQLEQK
ncbi:MAG: hypothetical protein AAB091_07095, partial [Elusimicrobiota bacterium]